MADLTLDLAECTVTFETEAHYEYPHRLGYLTGALQHPTLGELAKLRGIIVENRRSYKMHGDFIEMMDEESHEMMEFSMTLFDAHSNVRPWLIDGGRRSGSGCWGEELNSGEMLYLEDLTVEAQYRRRGVGSLLLQKLLQSPYVVDPVRNSNVFCWPMPPRSETDAASFDKRVEEVNAFFRKNGFRRIGRTSFFGYSPKPDHPSRLLPIENDPDRLGNEFPARADITPDQIQREYPLHSAIVNNKTDDIAVILAAAHAQDPAKIHQPDDSGFTPLYIAAAVPNLPAVRALLDLGVEDDFKNASNKENMTPLEKLQDTMRQNRELMEDIMGIWGGYSTETLECEYLLKKALGTPPMLETEAEYAFKRRFGCTCGECTDQWLSPRMRFRLLVTSQLDYDNMGMDLFYFKPPQPLSEDEIPSPNINYLPLALRSQIHKSFFQGFRSVFLVIAKILEAPSNNIPTPALVLAQAVGETGVTFYLDKGGRVEYALDAVIETAKEQSPQGDGFFEETWDNPEDPDANDEYTNLPKCANDLAFKLVRSKLGIDPRVANGPYYKQGQDVEMFDEEDEDEDDY